MHPSLLSHRFRQRGTHCPRSALAGERGKSRTAPAAAWALAGDQAGRQAGSRRASSHEGWWRDLHPKSWPCSLTAAGGNLEPRKLADTKFKKEIGVASWKQNTAAEYWEKPNPHSMHEVGAKTMPRDLNLTAVSWHWGFYSEHEQRICILGTKCTPHAPKQINARHSFIPQPGILILLINKPKKKMSLNVMFFCSAVFSLVKDLNAE